MDQTDHDNNPIRVMERAAKHVLLFNGSKCQYTREGISLPPPPNKIRHLNNMLSLKLKDDLKCLLGLTTYIRKVDPKLLQQGQPLHTRGRCTSSKDTIRLDERGSGNVQLASHHDTGHSGVLGKVGAF